ncbi:protein disulfide isomerase-like 5-4 [Raphanus sativus]|nr:protein disulfide isomerase-like 5-4 [Raphanus sativus]
MCLDIWEGLKEMVKKADAREEGLKLSPWFRLVVDNFLMKWWDHDEKGTLDEALFSPSRHSSLFSASLHLSPSISLVSASPSLSVDLSRLSLSLSTFLSSSDPSGSHSLDDAQTLSSSRRPSYALSQGHHSQGHHLSLSFDQTHIELSLLLHRHASRALSSPPQTTPYRILASFFFRSDLFSTLSKLRPSQVYGSLRLLHSFLCVNNTDADALLYACNQDVDKVSGSHSQVVNFYAPWCYWSKRLLKGLKLSQASLTQALPSFSHSSSVKLLSLKLLSFISQSKQETCYSKDTVKFLLHSHTTVENKTYYSKQETC